VQCATPAAREAEQSVSSANFTSTDPATARYLPWRWIRGLTLRVTGQGRATQGRPWLGQTFGFTSRRSSVIVRARQSEQARRSPACAGGPRFPFRGRSSLSTYRVAIRRAAVTDQLITRSPAAEMRLPTVEAIRVEPLAAEVAVCRPPRCHGATCPTSPGAGRGAAPQDSVSSPRVSRRCRAPTVAEIWPQMRTSVGGEPTYRRDSVPGADRPGGWPSIYAAHLGTSDGQSVPRLALLRVGFTEPTGSPRPLVRSCRTVSPLPVPCGHRRSALCCTFLRVAPTGR